MIVPRRYLHWERGIQTQNIAESDHPNVAVLGSSRKRGVNAWKYIAVHKGVPQQIDYHPEVDVVMHTVGIPRHFIEDTADEPNLHRRWSASNMNPRCEWQEEIRGSILRISTP